MTNVRTTTDTMTRNTLRLLANLAASDAQSAEMRQKKMNARSFFRTLGKRVWIQDVIESESRTARDVDRKDSAKSSLKFCESQLSAACFAYCLPTDYNVLDDAMWDLFHCHADTFANRIGCR